MLDFETDYEQWRSSRLKAWLSLSNRQFTPISDPKTVKMAEISQLHAQCAHSNLALYRLENPELGTKEAIRSMVLQLGMEQLDQNLCADQDKISTLKVMDLGRAQGYIPYTSKALNWHTDGYYNELHQHIRSFLLHCVQKASIGGENMLVNHELVYIKLRDLDPALVKALMQNDALTIPANVENGVEIRAQQTGPVFYRDKKTNTLQMRYTARGRNIEWKNEAEVHEAIAAIEQLLSDDDDLVLNVKLQAGEGLICNNILHGRTAFTNGNIPAEERVMYRARSYNRLFSNIGVEDSC